MIDFRKYRVAVKAVLEKESDLDKNWSWKIVKISKDKISIGWGYLDYIGDITAEEDPVIEGEINLIGRMPNGSKKYCFCGNETWCDVKTIGAGIGFIIHRMACAARSIY